MLWARCSVATLAVLSLAPRLGLTQPAVQLNHAGECPSSAQIEAAFAAEGVAIESGAELRVGITSEDGRVGLAIQRGAVPVTNRTVASMDCVAVAEAFALIVASTAVRAEPKEAAPAKVRSAQKTAPGATSVFDRTQLKEAEQASRSALSIGVAASLGLANDENRTTFVSIDSAYCQPAWCAGLALSVGDVSILEGFERRQVLAGIRLGRGWKGERLWIRALVGASAAVSTVSGVSGKTVTRVHPAVSASAVFGVPVTDRLSVRAEASAFGFPVADRYFSGSEILGESPRYQLFTGVGLEFHTDW